MSSSEDKYDTLEKIGHGSFGVIRKVRRKADGFIMCRKEISYLRMSQKEREQLHAEFQILSHLRHPNIVAYYHREHLKVSQDLHLYMEYCGNGDLGRVIKDLQHKNQRAQESFVWSIFSQLVMALYRCHYGVDPPEAGSNALGLTQGHASGTPKTPAGAMTILHRDLKPENVFLGEDNSVKLGDFGLSKMIKSQDFASTYVGTPFYMSPEICAAEKYTLKSDIWSLGCIIYELCAREPPFNAKTHFQLVQKIKDGRVAMLPDMYSPELNQVIRDCLKVNPDRRPDTVQLLNLPVVKLMRKEKEVVDLNRSLQSKEDMLAKRERELSERLASLDKEREAMRQELDASIRREWEVKARLEIDRLANSEIEHLQRRFEDEIKMRVEAELQKSRSDSSSSKSEPALPVSERSGTNSSDELSSATDATDYAMASPDASKEAKRSARTPFGRAQTMFAGHPGTPMDVEMVSPSPMAISNLSLSPRRNGATKAPASHGGNIFAVNNRKPVADPRWDLREPATLESDDDDVVIPSPTRNIRSTKNPFTSKNRPVLTTQKTCPPNRLRTKASNPGFVSKAASAQVEARPKSPTRQVSKIPSMANLQTEAGGGLARKHSVKKDTTGGETLGKVAAKNNIRGRTLVELQQARAGGRPASATGSASENISPKRVAYKERIAVDNRRLSGSASGSGGYSSSGSSSRSECVAIWDPEHDEMPSPFLVKQKRMINV